VNRVASRRARRTLAVTTAAYALLVALGACASGPPAARPPLRNDLPAEAPLGPGDTFDVSVYGELDLSGKYRVADDGSFNYQLVGRIDVAGLGAAAVADRIRDALVSRDILRAPNVSVTITEQVSKRFQVIGAVGKAGSYPFVPGTTALQAITVAGGLSAIARGDSVVLTRRVRGDLKRFKVPVESITEGEAEDIPIEPGDILFVPERIF
jgi:polysaccharide export outer membrane protein